MTLPDEVEAAAPCYRLFLRGLVRLSEFEHLSIDDVEVACQAVDALEAAEQRAAKRAGA